MKISIHAPSRGRLFCPLMIYHRKRFQSTPPHGGDETLFVMIVTMLISIHAPSRGRLQIDDPVQQQRAISIHAPSRGRLINFCILNLQEKFQSTPPHGGDKDSHPTQTVYINFNPRPLTGATAVNFILAFFSLFQSTPPHGGDMSFSTLAPFCCNFNPRPLTGATAHNIRVVISR